MQTNINKEDKNIVDCWDWADQGFTDNAELKRIYRRIRRRKLSRLLDKAIWEAIFKM